MRMRRRQDKVQCELRMYMVIYGGEVSLSYVKPIYIYIIFVVYVTMLTLSATRSPSREYCHRTSQKYSERCLCR